MKLLGGISWQEESQMTPSHAGRTRYPIAKGAEFSPPMFVFPERHQQVSIRHPPPAIRGPDMLGTMSQEFLSFSGTL